MDTKQRRVTYLSFRFPGVGGTLYRYSVTAGNRAGSSTAKNIDARASIANVVSLGKSSNRKPSSTQPQSGSDPTRKTPDTQGSASKHAAIVRYHPAAHRPYRPYRRVLPRKQCFSLEETFARPPHKPLYPLLQVSYGRLVSKAQGLRHAPTAAHARKPVMTGSRNTAEANRRNKQENTSTSRHGCATRETPHAIRHWRTLCKAFSVGLNTHFPSR